MPKPRKSLSNNMRSEFLSSHKKIKEIIKKAKDNK